MGQLYNSAAPLFGSDYAAVNKQMAQAAAEAMVYFGSTYENWDEIYADYKLVFGEE